jgi:hypothetical protein
MILLFPGEFTFLPLLNDWLLAMGDLLFIFIDNGPSGLTGARRTLKSRDGLQRR